jgi:hypothetical protein
VTLGYITIVTPIKKGQADDVESYLRNDVQPAFDPTTMISCRPLFPFDQVRGLHVCAMLILREHSGRRSSEGARPEPTDGSAPAGNDGSGSACLIFEATFDGTREEFLHDLLRVAPDGIDRLYQHCEGYPVSGKAAPNLIADYLLRSDAGAQTFYSGSPGRSVSQIRGEKQLRDAIVAFVEGRRIENDPPTTFLDLQREVQERVVRREPKNRWAEQPAVVPWEVAQRTLVAAAVGLFLAVAATALGAFIFWLAGLGPARLQDLAFGLMDSAKEFAGKLIDSYRFLGAIAYYVDTLPLPIPLPLVVLIFIWLGLRLIEWFIEIQKEQDDPRKEKFGQRYLVHMSIILRYAIVAFLVWFAVQELESTNASPPSWLVTLGLLFGALVVWLLLRHWVVSLRLLIQFQRLKPLQEMWRRFRLDIAHFAMAVVVVWAILIAGPQTPQAIKNRLGPAIDSLNHALVALTIYVVVGVLIAYAIGLVFFVAVRLAEIRDRRRYAPAADLIAERTDPSVYEREDGGVNKYQNHLASLTYVKPGFLRATLLRATLYLIGLLSRYWFNQGTLGGIPTILAARWVLLDGGRRLLFLTNYGGGWESYLDEFIDMGAVKGLNTIWSNTFIKPAGSTRPNAFPATRFWLWQGAQSEQAFKAYVRHSQVETIVWYGAYPTLSIVNVNTNTALRQALFKPLAAYELDSVFLNAGL